MYTNQIVSTTSLYWLVIHLLLSLQAGGVLSQGSRLVAVNVTCPAQSSPTAPNCTVSGASPPVSWTPGADGQTRSLTISVPITGGTRGTESIIAGNFTLDLSGYDDILQLSVGLQGTQSTWTTFFYQNNCTDNYVRRTSLTEVYSCRYVSSTSPVSVPVGVFSVGDGAGGFLWWQSFSQVQINITSKSTPSSNSSAFVASLRISGSNEPTSAGQCNCHPVGVNNASAPCNSTSRVCKCLSNYNTGNQCIPVLGSSAPFGPQGGGYWLGVTTSGYIGNLSLITVVMGDSYPCNVYPYTSVSTNGFDCNTTKSNISDLYNPLPITVCWSLLNNQTTACSILVDKYTYKPDPVIGNILPSKGYTYGGTNQTITGTNLDSIYMARPFLVVSLTTVGANRQTYYDPPSHKLNTSKLWTGAETDYTVCSIISNTTIVCATPPFDDYNIDFRDGFSALTFFLDYRYSCLFSSLQQTCNFHATSRFQPYLQVKFTEYVPDTQEYRMYDGVRSFEMDVDNSGAVVLTTQGAPSSEYIVTVGGVQATIASVFASNLFFFPPLPEPADSIFDKNGAKEILITVGYFNASIGYIAYQQTWIDTPEHRNALIGGLVGGVGGAIIIIVLVILICKWKKKSKDSKRRENPDPPTPHDEQSEFLNDLNPHLRSQVKKCLLDFSRVHLQKEIGKGYFGKVYCGTLLNDTNGTKENVAIKVLHGEHSGSDDREDFLREAAIMIDFAHVNVLTLLAIAIDHQTPYVILPLMEHGDLKSYISNPDNILLVADLINFGLQISEGMEYLSIKKFLHRDLAARNCMVNKDMVCKVADFGLARDIYQKDYYRPSKKPRPMPIKWMSIEAITDSIFTTKSDVWSYGVLLWELLTRGQKPYPEVELDYMTFYLRNNRLEKPPAAPEFMYDLMRSCWLPNPLDRPEFTDIKHNLKGVITRAQASKQGDVDTSARSTDKSNSYIELVEMVPASDYLTNK